MAGPPDVVDTEATLLQLGDPQTHAKLAEQSAALEGEQGAWLWAVSASDGTKRAASKLDAVPVFDGLAAAGRLYVATESGDVLCLGSP